ncbi:hypothetical protein MPSEU_000645100 [Mayamaea pseudoterrestris]|nr:hypothetical protein MPSEU_000645100 [Mayamaea pseudoterrestris]
MKYHMLPTASYFILVVLLHSALGWGWGGDGADKSNPLCQSPCVPGSEEIMSQKEHGTSRTPVQENLRWGCDGATADRICNYNRHYAEYSGYWETTSFLSESTGTTEPVTFYDSNTGKPLFKAPKGRSWTQFLEESRSHGWPSFRDDEVDWNNVRVLSNGETVSIDGTHLGHNLPDKNGNRYCINLVSIAGHPPKKWKRK